MASPRRSARVTPGSASSSSLVDAGQRRADRPRADHRLDLGGRAVRDDCARGPSARPGRRTRRPPRGSASRRSRSCRGPRTRASSPRRRVGPRRPWRRWARRARGGRGSLDERDREADALCLASRELLRAPAGDVADADEIDHLVDVERPSGTATRSSSISSRPVRSRDQRAGLEHRRRPDRGRRRPRAAGRTRDTSPASGGVRPSSMSIVVDLPAPFGPSSATVSPGAIEMSDVAHRLDAPMRRAERLDQTAQLHTLDGRRVDPGRHDVHCARGRPRRAAARASGTLTCETMRRWRT